MISRTWKQDKKVFSVPNGILEDFIVVKEDKYVAYYCRGSSFQKQSLFKSYSESPEGPFVNEEKVIVGSHIRLCKGMINSTDAILSAVTPGLPKCGLWLYERKSYGIVRSLLLNPKSSTLYSLVAANPTIIHDGEEYNIFFEGRDKKLTQGGKWRVFQALWDGTGGIKVIDEPFMIGANPFITKFKDKYYLYYSKHNGKGGFDTWMLIQ